MKSIMDKDFDWGGYYDALVEQATRESDQEHRDAGYVPLDEVKEILKKALCLYSCTCSFIVQEELDKMLEKK